MSQFLSRTEVLKARDTHCNVYMVLIGKDADGNQHFAYLLTTADKLPELHAALSRGNCDISKFGQIVRKGEGVPDPLTQKEMFTQRHFGPRKTNIRFFVLDEDEAA